MAARPTRPYDLLGRPYDLLIYGASGFTGRLVSLYLARNAPPSLRWAIAGRDREKLQKIADECKRETAKDVAVVVGRGEVAALTQALITTAGPYMLYGEPLLAACVQAGTDYADLTGETLWVHQMLAKYGEQARASGAVIVPMSGFDSVPADLGTFFLAAEVRRTLGVRLNDVQGFVAAKGSVSGGTIASGLNMAKHPDRGLASDPFLLHPARSEPGFAPTDPALSVPEATAAAASDFRWPFWVPTFGSWAWFWVMSSINTRVVRRSAAIFALHGEALAGNPHTLPPLPAPSSSTSPAGSAPPPLAYSSAPFKYTEWSLARSWWEAFGGTLTLGLVGLLLSLPGGTSLLRLLVPAPGQGPSDETIRTNWFQYFIVGRTEEAVPRTVIARVHGRDGGYGDTSCMLAEAGMLLATHRAALPGAALGGGFLTPATAFGSALVERLHAVNLRFEMVPSVEVAARLARTPGPPAPKGVPTVF